MCGCEHDSPLLGPLNTRCSIILRTQKGTIILTTVHVVFWALMVITPYIQPGLVTLQYGSYTIPT